MTSPTATSSTTSSQRSSYFLFSTEFLSLAAFGLISLAVTSWERQKKKKKKSSSSTTSVSRVQHPFLPPTTLVQYLHRHGGKKWSHYDEPLEQFVRTCPKVELHVHLDGSLDPDFLWNCMKQYGDDLITCLPVTTTLPWDPQKPLPVRKLVQDCQTPDEFHDLCTCRRGQRSLQNMLTCFELFLPLVRGAPLLLIEELAHDFCRRQWEQHVVYTEVRYNPHLLIRESENDDAKEEEGHGSSDMGETHEEENNQNSGKIGGHRLQSAREIVQAITRGLRRGCQDYNIVVNQILCAINWRPDWAMDVLELAHEFRNEHPCGVVGVDIAAGEEHFDQTQFPHLYQQHFDMMQQAQQLGIPIAIHAGETPDGIQNIQRAVATRNHKTPGYGAKRIGHGYRMAESPELMEQLAKAKIHVEICPTSSVETGGWMFDHPTPSTDDMAAATVDDPTKPSKDMTSFTPRRKPWKEHPGLTMMRHGVSISLSSDDPAVFHTSLAWQYRIALAKMGLTPEELAQTNVDAIGASFAPPEEKAKVRKVLEEYRDILAKGEDLSSSSHVMVSDTKRFSDRVRDIQ